MLCFRFEERGDHLLFVHTDKFGDALSEFEIVGPNKWAIEGGYSFWTISESFFNVGLRHRAYRFLGIPKQARIQHTEVDPFRVLLSRQGQSECNVPLVFTGAEQISLRSPQ